MTTVLLMPAAAPKQAEAAATAAAVVTVAVAGPVGGSHNVTPHRHRIQRMHHWAGQGQKGHLHRHLRQGDPKYPLAL